MEQELLDLEPLVKTKLAWDLLTHSQMEEWLPRLGLTPAASDVADLEHQEAHARAKMVAPLVDLTEVYAALATEVQAVVIGRAAQASPEAVSDFTDEAFLLVRGAVLAILAEFLADGILAYGPAIEVRP